jgi:hypothetical protein
MHGKPLDACILAISKHIGKAMSLWATYTTSTGTWYAHRFSYGVFDAPEEALVERRSDCFDSKSPSLRQLYSIPNVIIVDTPVSISLPLRKPYPQTLIVPLRTPVCTV